VQSHFIYTRSFINRFRFQTAVLLLAWILLFSIGATKTASAQFSRGMQMSFGKNRVQYNNWFWNFYRYQNFDIYYYGDKDLSVYTAKVALLEKEDIEKALDFRMDGRIQFFIFNKLSDLKQSNIGLVSDEQYNTGGVTNIVGRKVLLHFDGDHEKFKEQIRKGIAQVEINELLYGGDIRDMLQNAAMLNLPDWFVQGLTSYYAKKWDVVINNRVKDGILSGRYKKFNRLSGEDAVLAGHSIWNYISEVFGESSIANIVYMTRLNKNTESGFLFVLGISFKEFNANWLEYYKKKYKSADSSKVLPTEKPIIRPRAKFNYSQLKASPDGHYAAFTTNEIGKYKVWLYDLEKKKRKKIKKGNYKTLIQETDLSFPVLAWHPSGKILTLIREYKGKIMLGNYTLETKKYEENQLLNFEKVLDASYSDDGTSLLLSAVIRSHSDLYIYNLRTHTFEQLTKDFYDDFNPRFMAGSKQIVFSSNRVNDTLNVDKADTLPPNNNTDIFIYDYKTRSAVLKRVTNTPFLNESQPLPLDSASLLFLSNKNGVIDRYKAMLDSTISYVDTVEHYRFTADIKPVSYYARNIVSHDISRKGSLYLENIFLKGKFYMYQGTVQSKAALLKGGDQQIYGDLDTPFPARLGSDTAKAIKEEGPAKIVQVMQDPDIPALVEDTTVKAPEGYTFENDLPDRKKKPEKREDMLKKMAQRDSMEAAQKKFRLPKLRIYETAYAPNYFVTQLDNSLLNTAYQAYSGGSGYYNPPLNAFFKIGISDLLEDYRITGGVKLSYNLKSNEYFFSYENLKKRLDKQWLIYQGGRELPDAKFSARIRTYEIRYVNKWPFSETAAIRGSVSFRNDRTVYLSESTPSLQEPDLIANWGGLKGEYIFDNVINRGLNLYNGTRLKFFGEFFKQVNKPKTSLFAIGFDIRNYIKIHRELIWANRLAGSTSFGDQKIIYFLGGVDNEFITGPNYDNQTNIDNSQHYAYQAIATNMRGFKQNIRNGNSFMVYNSELRLPIFRYLIPRPIKSDLLRNLQIAAFGDIGAAWSGRSPFSENNTVNKQVIYNGPMVITITTVRDPIIAGYGWGLRSRVFGYFVRGDWAWGYSEGIVRPRIFYVSLSLDF
jgi:hypothetical protein